jgi:WhiB family redox-sensing transcriptional regulator
MNFVTSETTWRAGAECAGVDPEVFFPEPGDEAAEEVALAFCAACPVREACLEWALEANEKLGVLGGATEARRRSIRRRRASARRLAS